MKYADEGCIEYICNKCTHYVVCEHKTRVKTLTTAINDLTCDDEICKCEIKCKYYNHSVASFDREPPSRVSYIDAMMDNPNAL